MQDWQQMIDLLQERGIEFSLGIIKPEGLKNGHGHTIQRLVLDAGLFIKASVCRQFTRLEAEEFYAHHRGAPHFNETVEAFSAGPALLMLVGGSNAVRTLKTITGHYARRERGTIRGETMRPDDPNHLNNFHSSEDEASRDRELAICFPRLNAFP